MGQLIEVEAVRLGAVTIFDTDRTLSGQDGETYRRGEAKGVATYPGQVAELIFGTDESVSSVFIYSNTVSIEREGEWTDDIVEALSAAIRNSLIFYEENRD